MARPSTPWHVDHDADALRPFLVTGGRTSPTHELDLMSLLRATGPVTDENLLPEHFQALEACRNEPATVAEVATSIGQPIQVAKILLADLLDRRAVILRLADVQTSADDLPDDAILKRLLNGLRNLPDDRAS